MKLTKEQREILPAVVSGKDISFDTGADIFQAMQREGLVYTREDAWADRHIIITPAGRAALSEHTP